MRTKPPCLDDAHSETVRRALRVPACRRATLGEPPAFTAVGAALATGDSASTHPVVGTRWVHKRVVGCWLRST